MIKIHQLNQEDVGLSGVIIAWLFVFNKNMDNDSSWHHVDYQHPAVCLVSLDFPGSYRDHNSRALRRTDFRVSFLGYFFIPKIPQSISILCWWADPQDFLYIQKRLATKTVFIIPKFFFTTISDRVVCIWRTDGTYNQQVTVAAVLHEPWYKNVIFFHHYCLIDVSYSAVVIGIEPVSSWIYITTIMMVGSLSLKGSTSICINLLVVGSTCIRGWWFQTFLIFPNIWKDWLVYWYWGGGN